MTPEARRKLVDELYVEGGNVEGGSIGIDHHPAGCACSLWTCVAIRVIERRDAVVLGAVALVQDSALLAEQYNCGAYDALVAARRAMGER